MLGSSELYMGRYDGGPELLLCHPGPCNALLRPSLVHMIDFCKTSKKKQIDLCIDSSKERDREIDFCGILV